MTLEEKIYKPIYNSICDCYETIYINYSNNSVNNYVWLTACNFVRIPTLKSVGDSVYHSIDKKLRSYDFKRKN
jgi:hypothetical protein